MCVCVFVDMWFLYWSHKLLHPWGQTLSPHSLSHTLCPSEGVFMAACSRTSRQCRLPLWKVCCRPHRGSWQINFTVTTLWFPETRIINSLSLSLHLRLLLSLTFSLPLHAVYKYNEERKERVKWKRIFTWLFTDGFFFWMGFYGSSSLLPANRQFLWGRGLGQVIKLNQSLCA